MHFPENLKYTKDHEWVEIDGETAKVGITDFAQNELGDIVFIEIESEGETLEEGEVFGTVEAVKTVSDLFMPVAGEVVEINPDLEANPETVNSDPYGAGWMVKINFSSTEGLLSVDEYKALIGES